MDENDRLQQMPATHDPRASVVSLVTLTDSTLASIVNTREPTRRKHDIATVWIFGSMAAIVIQLMMVALATIRARDIEEMKSFLSAIYPLMLRFNLSVLCPPVVYMVAGLFGKTKEPSNT